MRGQLLQPAKDCKWCDNPLPLLRHPDREYCGSTCRQRSRLQQERGTKGVRCLECGKCFVRVGSHVVQVHGYESTLEYREQHGLLARETRTKEHANQMRAKVANVSIRNLSSGEKTRFKEGGDHGEQLKEFWANRRDKKMQVNV